MPNKLALEQAVILLMSLYSYICLSFRNLFRCQSLRLLALLALSALFACAEKPIKLQESSNQGIPLARTAPGFILSNKDTIFLASETS